MPGRKKQKYVEKKAPGQPVPLLVAERPKRQIIPKKLDNEGISWREEKMLQKALYASLHPNAALNRFAAMSKSSSAIDSMALDQPGTSSGYVSCSEPSGSGSFRHGLGRLKHKPGRKRVKMKSNLQRLKSDLKLMMPGQKGSEATGNSTPISTTSASSNNSNNKGSTYKAQRKFAQGSVTTSPNVTPVKYSLPRAPSPVKYMLKKPPKTEDFLTFLCLRGTNLLPKEMEFFNYCDPDLLRAMNSPNKSSQSTSRGLGAGCRGGGGKSPAQSRAPSPVALSECSTEPGVKQLVTRAYASCYASHPVTGACSVDESTVSSQHFTSSASQGDTTDSDTIVMGDLEEEMAPPRKPVDKCPSNTGNQSRKRKKQRPSKRILDEYSEVIVISGTETDEHNSH